MLSKAGKGSGLVRANDNCTGCNKCIQVCGVMGACIATETLAGDRSCVRVDGERCIVCGACFDACEHSAREYKDDTIRFFEDLARGVPISLLIAPAFKANYPDQYEQILGTLRALGAKRMISVSFGADIATWGIVKYIRERDFSGAISQACPVVVDYIEKYEPELIPRLMPVQSPLMCSAIYARSQLGIQDRLAFISPCIAKKIEIDAPQNKGLVSYNVTFDHLMDYLRTHEVPLGTPCTDELPYDLGTIWPMPGGLAEYARWLTGDDVFIRQIDGELKVIEYLHTHAGEIANRETPYLFIDVLNCERGCLCGTATELKHARSDNALYRLVALKQQVKRQSALTALTPQQRMVALDRRFQDLKLEDYLRSYSDKSNALAMKEPTEEELIEVFHQMRKDTEEAQNINCTACGYHSCREMAGAIWYGFTRKENCIHYLKDSVECQKQRLQYVAEHDEFLDVYNRRALIEQIEALPAGTNYALALVNLNGFKGINETYGHREADKILIQIAGYLKQCAAAYGGAVARLKNDEFLILYPDRALSERSAEVMDVVGAVESPVWAGSDRFHMTARIGVVNAEPASNPDQTPSKNIEYAEMAMRSAKSTDQTSVALYGETLKTLAREERQINLAIQDMIENDGFHMLYQPQVDIGSNLVVGYEALVRASYPDMYPGKFIPVAEQNGLIWKIGRITTELVIRQLAAWRALGVEVKPVSINFSSMQLSDEGYLGFLKEMLEQYRVPAHLVEIEITESCFVGKTDQAIGLFEHFKAMGITLLMDDFGTGYSSLGYLTYLPVDVIKLDKSIVDTYLVPGKDHFIENVIRLVHDLGKKIIIEGVETGEQVERLRALNADVIQGYYYSKPISPENAIAYRVK